MIRQRLCEALHAAGRANEAGESLLEIVNNVDKEVYIRGPITTWHNHWQHRVSGTYIIGSSSPGQPRTRSPRLRLCPVSPIHKPYFKLTAPTPISRAIHVDTAQPSSGLLTSSSQAKHQRSGERVMVFDNVNEKCVTRDSTSMSLVRTKRRHVSRRECEDDARGRQTQKVYGHDGHEDLNLSGGGGEKRKGSKACVPIKDVITCGRSGCTSSA